LPIRAQETSLPSSPNRERLWLALLLLGTALLAFWSLGSLPLVDVDEPVYGQVGKEMVHSGPVGWLTPHYGGLSWFDKPPLFYWLTALSMRLFGVSEFAARAPSALLAVGLVAVTYVLARRAYPQTPRAALWAGFALATSVQFFLLARAAVTDMTLAFTLTSALLALYTWTQVNQARWIVLAGVMTGLAALTKGPVALVLIGVQTIAFLCLTRQAKRLLSPALWGGFALCLLVGLPWFLLMIHLHGKLFIDGFLEANNVTRYLQAEHKETSNATYFFKFFPALFWPWALLLPSLLISAILRKRVSGPTLFLLLWSVLVFGFFSASQTKLITYIFPMYSSVAILLGRWLSEQVEKQKSRSANLAETLLLFVPLWLYAALAVVLAVALNIVGKKFGITVGTLLQWDFTLGGSAVAIIAFRRHSGVWLVPGTAMALFLLITWCSPTWKIREADVSERKMAVFAALTTPPDGVIHALGFKHPSLRYYSDQPVIYTDDHAVAALNIKQHPGVVYAMRTSDEDELREKYGVGNLEELWRYGRTVLVRAMPRKP